MDASDRILLAKTISIYADEADGFVVTHGTDTMPETAAALTYLVQNLGKPIVITGSQQSFWEAGSDARNNVFRSVQAATLSIGEVVICFDKHILRGPRTIKYSEFDRDAFYSPRVLPVGEIGYSIKLAPHVIPSKKSEMELYSLDSRVEFYQQTSGSSSMVLESFVDREDVQGIVLGGFGAGNVHPKLLRVFRAFKEKQKPVVIITNCMKGAAAMQYGPGYEALLQGAIPAGDMTREAATQKLMYALGNTIEGNKLEYVRRIMHTKIGEDIS